MTTYTIAMDGDMLIACIPDGEDLDAAILMQTDAADCPLTASAVYTGLTLTDDEPEDRSRIVYSGHEMGWLTEEDGTPRDYAIRA